MAMTPEEREARRAYNRARDARLKAEREADPVKLAEWRARCKATYERRKATIQADPELTEKERERRRRDRANAAARAKADPERLEHWRKKSRQYEAARRDRLREQGIPREPRLKRPPINPEFTPFLVSSPDMSAPRMPEAQHRPHVPEPKIPFVIERESWKPSEHFQALLDASDDAPKMSLNLHRLTDKDLARYEAQFGEKALPGLLKRPAV